MTSEQIYKEVNDLLTEEFVEFQKTKTEELIGKFAGNINELDRRNVAMLASNAFIKSSRSWLDKLEETGKEAFTIA